MRYGICFFFLIACTLVKATDHIASSAEEAKKLCAAARAGDKIILKAGTYVDAVIQFSNNNGTSAQPITFTAEKAGAVFFTGNSSLSFRGSYLIVEGFTWTNGGGELGTRSVIEINGSYSFFRNCVINDYNNNDLTVDNKWVSVYGQYNTVERCLLKNKKNLGATVTVWLTNDIPAYHTISHNYFLNRINGPNAENGLESIRIGDSKTSFTQAHCVVAFNRFEDCDGEIEIISNKSCNNSYLHNTFFNNNGGLTLRHGNNCLVDGNVFDGGKKERSYGVRIIGEGHVVTNNYFFQLKGSQREPFRAPITVVNGLEKTPLNGYFQVRRAVIESNIFVNNIAPLIRLGARSNRSGMTLAPDSVSITTNVFVDDNCNGGEIYEDVSFSTNVCFTGNTVYGKCLRTPKKGFDKHPAAKRDGFDRIIDAKGNAIASVEDKPQSSATAGASYVNPLIQKTLENRRYTYTTSGEAGPSWKY